MSERNLMYGAILQALADGAAHPVATLAHDLDVSVAQLDKLIATLREYGADLHLTRAPDSVAWHHPATLLTAEDIGLHVGAHTRQRLGSLTLQTVCDSTNKSVLRAGPPQGNEVHVALAEYQRAGRGRHGRVWQSPLASGICMTVAMRHPRACTLDSTLTLALGVAVSAALLPLVDAEILLKWPNDLILEGRKLGGILTEMDSAGSDGGVVRVGIGINVDLPTTALMELPPHALPPVGLASVLREGVTRAMVAAAVLDSVATQVDAFWQRGFAPVMRTWRERDYLCSRPVRVTAADEITLGIAEGIREDGALVVNVDGQRHYLHSGDVSVRAQ